ncbi:MAG: FAD-dependent oxidoreductase, partial [Planctomycetota bacterium]
KNGVLGGTLTVAGVNDPALFHAWGRQVIAGIGWELVRHTLAETCTEPPDFSDPTAAHWKHHVRVNKAIYAALSDQAVVEAGVEMLLHAMPAAVALEEGRWRVDVCTKSGLQSTAAKVLIDCTGDANAVALAGFELLRHEPAQPGTLVMHCSGYDPDELDVEAIDIAARQAVEDGELLATDVGWRPDEAAGFLRGHGHNRNHVTVVEADSSEGRTGAEIAARRSMLRMHRFFRSQPGLENFRIDYFAPECGIRETVVIRGKATITGADYVAGRRYDDAVCYCFYPIDIHLDHGRGVDLRPLDEGVLPTIPRGAMLPAGSRCLIVAGRCISGDKEAHSAYRVEAPCMATGQAAGAMAALSARTRTDPEDLPIADVHDLLRRHGAIIPGDVVIE